MTGDGEPPISCLQNVAICFAIIGLATLAFGSAGALAVWLPFWLKPLALAPIALFARYGAGKTWLESGCLVIQIGVVIAVISAITTMVRNG